jgi:hypothetical protein
MLNLATTPPAVTILRWMARLEAEFTGASGRPAAGEDELEPMVELMTRTEGVCQAAVEPLQAGLGVTVGLLAPDATTALEQAQALVSSCARYAHLGELTVRQARVVSEPSACGMARPGRAGGTKAVP